MLSLWDSPVFFLVLGALFALYFSLPEKKRWAPILILGLFLLFWFNHFFAFLFLALAILNFIITRPMIFSRPLYFLAIACNLSFFLYYKYFHSTFFLVGLSFFIFQQLSYLIDVSRSADTRAEHLGKYLTYSFCFLNFSTGPLERSNKMIAKLHSIALPDSATIRTAGLFILWGLFKKMAVADNLAPFISKVFSVQHFEKSDLLPALLFNKYEIYANFSGYTDMVIGAGLLFGLTFTPNFKRPFSATNIVDYWKRWHLSLSYWIRDYVYYPLSLSPFSRLGAYFILLITFLVFSLWHDLKTTFALYALIQVALIFLSHKTQPLISMVTQKINSERFLTVIRVFQRAWVYCLLVSLPSVLFRAQNTNSALTIFKSLTELGLSDYGLFLKALAGPLLLNLLLIIFCEVVEYVLDKKDIARWLTRLSYSAEVACYVMALLLFLILAKFDANTGFIYGRY